jgi:hypothetical protein
MRGIIHHRITSLYLDLAVLYTTVVRCKKLSKETNYLALVADDPIFLPISVLLGTNYVSNESVTRIAAKSCTRISNMAMNYAER